MPHVAVIGPGDAADGSWEVVEAEAAGRALAVGGAVVVCGGLGGVMAAAAPGAAGAGGTVLGLLPGTDRGEANPWVTVAVPTGLGEGRNMLVVRSADAVVAIGGGDGKLSEIALALRSSTPVVGVRTWELARQGVPDGRIVRVGSGTEAAARALELAGGATPGGG